MPHGLLSTPPEDRAREQGWGRKDRRLRVEQSVKVKTPHAGCVGVTLSSSTYKHVSCNKFLNLLCPGFLIRGVGATTPTLQGCWVGAVFNTAPGTWRLSFQKQRRRDRAAEPSPACRHLPASSQVGEGEAQGPDLQPPQADAPLSAQRPRQCSLRGGRGRGSPGSATTPPAWR